MADEVEPMNLAVLTGGGDAAGLNAAIRAITLTARRGGHDVWGVRDGWAGLLGEDGFVPLDDTSVAGALGRGGTLLGSSRTNPLAIAGGLDRLRKALDTHDMNALIAIGGDDTLSVAAALADHGGRVVGLPKTIDFDLNLTEYCIGFDTATAVVTDALDRLRTTGDSHHRIMVCEVMGRDTGWLAVAGGLAGGADLVIIPEFSMSLDEIVSSLERRDPRASSSLIVVAEAATIEGLPGHDDVAETDAKDGFGHAALRRRAIGERLADALEQITGRSARATVLGHIQRGGSPVASDRIWASRLGVAAVKELENGASGVCCIVSHGEVTTVPLRELIAKQKRVSKELYGVIQTLR